MSDKVLNWKELENLKIRAWAQLVNLGEELQGNFLQEKVFAARESVSQLLDQMDVRAREDDEYLGRQNERLQAKIDKMNMDNGQAIYMAEEIVRVTSLCKDMHGCPTSHKMAKGILEVLRPTQRRPNEKKSS